MARRSQRSTKASVLPADETGSARPQSTSSLTVIKEILEEYGKLSATELINAILEQVEHPLASYRSYQKRFRQKQQCT
ncbi:hypothetical protein Y032_0009g765 [Ancylostoma ceylanicum]|uniref:Uncharacterized protein n=1 Tax=Ancylostoma ceylanicum TaxID=53326 RepID=A0A016VL65_9BILA|nr:hypothetical protein Y032_0009g765 [Ancylostoma ceylanicum]